jgi:hypothetical protein
MSGTTAVTYQLQYRATGTLQWINYGLPVTGDSEIVTGLLPNTYYDFQVVASNAVGTVISPIVTSLTPSGPSTAWTTGAVIAGAGVVVEKPSVRAVTKIVAPGVGGVVINAITTSSRISFNPVGSVNAVGVVTAKAVVSSVLGAGNVTAITSTTTTAVQSAIAASGTMAVTALKIARPVVTIGGSGTATVIIQGNLVLASAHISGTAAVGVSSSEILQQQWSSTHKYANIALSNNSLTATEATAAGNSSVYASTSAAANLASGAVSGLAVSGITTNAVTLNWVAPSTAGNTGKYYWEIFISCASPASIAVGIGNINAGVGANQWVGSDSNGVGWLISQGTVDSNGIVIAPTAPNPPTAVTETSINTTSIALSWTASAPTTQTNTQWGTAASGATLCFALDLFNGIIWGRVGSGNWCGSTTANPTLGVTGGGLPIPATVLAAAVAPGCTLNAIGDFCIGQFASNTWLFTPPSGFQSWDVSNNPPPPNNLTASNVSTTSLTITWTAS